MHSWRTLRAVLTAIVAVTMWFIPVGGATLAPWVIGAALLAGLPHGGLDHLISKRWNGWKGFVGQIRFHSAYLFSMVGILIGWFFAPSAALLVFLASAI